MVKGVIGVVEVICLRVDLPDQFDSFDNLTSPFFVNG